MSVHGSKDDRAAIRRAVRATFADLQERRADRLCEDFTAAADARLARGVGDCARRVGEVLGAPSGAGRRAGAPHLPTLGRLRVTDISFSGDRASAVSSEPRKAGSELRWRLRLRGGRWRIDAPATLALP